MRIITVTLNPAVDQTVELDRLVPGQVHRANRVRSEAGGKGVNVASTLVDWGAHVAATGLLGRDNAALFEALLTHKEIEDCFVRIDGPTRTNIKLVDGTETTDVNLPGLSATRESLDAVTQLVRDRVGPDTLVVLSGSLPPRCPDEHYAALVATFTSRGARVLLDASGPALSAALASSPLPFCIKPNRHELSAWAGRPLGVADLAATSQQLHARGIALVVVSMGAEGALFTSSEGALHAKLAVTSKASTVGAGDAMVAGIAAALADRLDLEQLARLATGFASARLQSHGARVLDPTEIRAQASQVTITAVHAGGGTHE